MPDPRLDAVLGSPAFARRDGSVVALPFLATEGEDNLRIITVCSVAGVAVTIGGRARASDGTLSAFAHVVAPPSDRSVLVTDVALAPGYLVNLAAYASAGTPKIGECFVIVQLIRGFSGATIVVGELLADYVTARQAVAWPGSPIRSSIEGGGCIKTFEGTQPAAGADIFETVPDNTRWELIAVRAVLTCSSTAANRKAQLFIRDQVAGSYAAGFTRFVSASANQQHFHYWGRSVDEVNVQTENWWAIPLPHDVILLATHQVRIFALAMQAGDQWTAPFLHVREWLEVDN